MAMLPTLMFCVTLIAIGALAVYLSGLRGRMRRRALAAGGVHTAPRLSRREKRARFDAYAHLHDELAGGHTAIRWWADGAQDGLKADLFFHSYVTLEASGIQSKEHTVAGAHCPEDWPEVLLEPKGLGHKILERLGTTGAPLELELPEFNKRWRVRTPDHDFALLLLTPETQRLLADAPKAETWHIGVGRVTLLRAERVSSTKGMVDMVARVIAVRRQAPPELDHYQSEAI